MAENFNSASCKTNQCLKAFLSLSSVFIFQTAEQKIVKMGKITLPEEHLEREIKKLSALFFVVVVFDEL